jgi:hypothetical protein
MVENCVYSNCDKVHRVISAAAIILDEKLLQNTIHVHKLLVISTYRQLSRASVMLLDTPAIGLTDKPPSCSKAHHK